MPCTQNLEIMAPYDSTGRVVHLVMEHARLDKLIQSYTGLFLQHVDRRTGWVEGREREREKVLRMCACACLGEHKRECMCVGGGGQCARALLGAQGATATVTTSATAVTAAHLPYLFYHFLN